MAVEDIQELTAVLNVSVSVQTRAVTSRAARKLVSVSVKFDFCSPQVIKNNKVQAAKPKAKKKKGKKQGYAVVERATFDEYDDMGYGNDMDDFM